MTSVLLPSQPRFPAALIMKRHEESMYRALMTPVRWPGTIRNGTAEWFPATAAAVSCLRS